MADSLLLDERDTVTYATILRDANGGLLVSSSILTLTLTLTDQGTGDVLNSRNAQSVLNENGGTLGATDARFVMTFSGADNALADLTALEEHHRALFEATWAGGGSARWPVDLWVRALPSLPTATPVLSDAALLTLQEARDALKLTTAEQNAWLAYLVNVVSARLETETGRRLASREYADEHLYIMPTAVYAIGWDAWETPITDIALLDIGGVPQTVWLPGDPGSPADADVFCLSPRDRIYRHAGWPSGGAVHRTYTAGYDPIPDDLKEAAAGVLRHFYYLRDRQAAAVASRSAGAETITYFNTALPTEVVPVIRSYKRVPT